MHKRGISVVAVLVMALAGCSSDVTPDGGSFFERAVVPDGEIRLDDAALAFFVGPQHSETTGVFGQSKAPGYLVLAGDDGSISAVRTEPMDMMKPAWSEHGLFFADRSTDYRLTPSGLARSGNPKAAAQNLMFTLPGGGAVGVFNRGHDGDGDGYTDHVAVNADSGARRTDVQGNYFTGARCGDEVFGIAENPGKHQAQAPKTPEYTSTASDTFKPQMLARLYPAGAGGEVRGWRPNFGSTPIGEVPCHDGVITFVSWDADAAGTEVPSVVSWDTTTGKAQARPLSFDDGGTLNFDDFGYTVQDWHDGRLQWVYADGRVFSTDSATGRTTTLFTSAPVTGAGRPTQTFYTFTETALHALSTVSGAEGDLTYTALDRTTGATLRTITIKIPNTEVDIPNLNLSYLTVRPEAA